MSTRELGIAQVPGTPRARGTPLGPISQCIDTHRGNGFGIPLRKYTRFVAGEWRRFGQGPDLQKVEADFELCNKDDLPLMAATSMVALVKRSYL